MYVIFMYVIRVHVCIQRHRFIIYSTIMLLRLNEKLEDCFNDRLTSSICIQSRLINLTLDDDYDNDFDEF